MVRWFVSIGRAGGWFVSIGSDRAGCGVTRDDREGHCPIELAHLLMMIAELAVVLLVALQYFDFFHLLCGIARGCGGSRDDNGEYKLREVHDDADMIIVLLRVDLIN